MKTIIVLLVIIVSVWYFGFYSKNAIFQDYSGQSGYFVGQQLCPQLVPRNPYASDAGEYRGYEYAATGKVTSCASDTTYFSRGCREYLRQVAALNECVKANSTITK